MFVKIFSYYDVEIKVNDIKSRQYFLMIYKIIHLNILKLIS